MQALSTTIAVYHTTNPKVSIRRYDLQYVRKRLFLLSRHGQHPLASRITGKDTLNDEERRWRFDGIIPSSAGQVPVTIVLQFWRQSSIRYLREIRRSSLQRQYTRYS